LQNLFQQFTTVRRCHKCHLYRSWAHWHTKPIKTEALLQHH